MHSHRSAAERARHALLNARADPDSSDGLQNLPNIADIGDAVASALGLGSLAAEDSPSSLSSSTTSSKISSSTTSTVSQPATKSTTTSSSSRFTTSSSTSIPQKSSSSASSQSSSSSSSIISSESTASATSSSSLAYTAYIPSQTAQNDATTTGGISGGAIGAVVAVVLLVIIGIVLFFIRKAYIRRRQLRRDTWGANMYPSYQEKNENFNEKLSSPPPVPQKEETNSNNSKAMRVSHTEPLGTSAGATFTITPPPMTYNNPLNETYHEMSQAPNSPSNLAIQKIDGPKVSSQGEMTFVKCLFVPTLPDELSITAGEAVHVLNAYDDGWALCVNGRGEQGMVPLECLARNANGTPGPGIVQSDSTTSDGRMSKRMSSIYRGN